MKKMEEKKKRTWEEKGCLEYCAGDGLRVDHCLPLEATLHNSELFSPPPAPSPLLDIQFIASRDKIEYR